MAREVFRKEECSSYAETESYHGGPEVESALHLEEGISLKGKNIYFGGNLPSRWDFGNEMVRRGARVTMRDVNVFANPLTRPGKRAPEFKKKNRFDQVVIYMGLAFYKGKALGEILNASMNSVNFKDKGEFKAVSLDFTSMENAAPANASEVALHALMHRFFQAGGFDSHQGSVTRKTIQNVLEKKGLDSKLVVEEAIHMRPVGAGGWGELYDLSRMLAEQSGEAALGMSKVPPLIRALFLNGKIKEYQDLEMSLKAVQEEIKILAKNKTTTPTGTPPTIHTVTVRAREEAP
ncbi:MAG: hypothetical protein V4437_01140 [Patescibacteria group bacterium]